MTAKMPSLLALTFLQIIHFSTSLGLGVIGNHGRIIYNWPGGIRRGAAGISVEGPKILSTHSFYRRMSAQSSRSYGAPVSNTGCSQEMRAVMLRGALYNIFKYINVHRGPESRSWVTHGKADLLGSSEHLLFYVTDSSEQKNIIF